MSVAEGASLWHTELQTPKTGFIVTGLILYTPVLLWHKTPVL